MAGPGRNQPFIVTGLVPMIPTTPALLSHHRDGRGEVLRPGEALNSRGAFQSAGNVLERTQ